MRNLKKSSNNHSDTRKIKKILDEEMRFGINPGSDSETEAADLDKELFPLGHYINNREEMIEQMFSIIKGAKLKKMLPPILKDLPLDEIKADCLIHLLGMSKKRILSILEGREINYSSDSDSQSDSSTSPNKRSKRSIKPIVIKQEGCSDISDNSEEVVLVNPDLEVLDLTGDNPKTNTEGSGHSKRRKNHKQRKRNSENIQISNKRPALRDHKVVDDNKERKSSESSSHNENDIEVTVPTEGKTLLEILELEMRARAIRALLQKSDTPKESDNSTEKPSSSINNEPDQIEKDTVSSEKVVPVKNFRKKKRKNDDVIVITPKLITIDLTDENDQIKSKKKKTGKTLECSLPDNIENKTLKDFAKSSKPAEIVNDIEESYRTSETEHVPDVGIIEDQTVKTAIVASIEQADQVSDQIDSEDRKKTGQARSNWAQRWLESKEVKKVVSTSKICGNIRKRIKIARLAKKIQDKSQKLLVDSQEMVGSVGEYELLPKSSRANLNDGFPQDDSLEASTTSSPFEVGKETVQEIESQEIPSSTEQVQDITSTKSEISAENLLDYNAVSDSRITMSDIDHSQAKNNISKTDTSLTVNASPTKHEQNDTTTSKIEEFEIRQVGENEFKSGIVPIKPMSTVEACKTIMKNDSNISVDKKEETPKLTVDFSITNESTISSKNPSDLNAENDRIEICKSNLVNITHSEDDLDDSKLCIANSNPKMSVSNSDINLKNTNCETKDAVDNSVAQQTTVHSPETNLLETENVCQILKKPKRSTKESSVEQEVNEPETLEINITDEDREIDGIMDENIEIGQEITSASDVIEID